MEEREFCAPAARVTHVYVSRFSGVERLLEPEDQRFYCEIL